MFHFFEINNTKHLLNLVFDINIIDNNKTYRNHVTRFVIKTRLAEGK